MGRRSARVSELAARLQRPVEDVFFDVLELGFDVLRPSDVLKDRQLEQAELQLGLKSHGRKEERSIANLAKEAHLDEKSVRKILHDGSVLKKKRLKRVPVHEIDRARVLLGITKKAAAL